MKKSAIDIWVGLFVTIGMLAMLFLALKVGNMSAVSFAPTYTVSARFDNIGGLKPRAPVKVPALWSAVFQPFSLMTKPIKLR